MSRGLGDVYKRQELQREMHMSSRTLVKRRDDGLAALMAMGQYMEGVMREQVRI